MATTQHDLVQEPGYMNGKSVKGSGRWLLLTGWLSVAYQRSKLDPSSGI